MAEHERDRESLNVTISLAHNLSLAKLMQAVSGTSKPRAADTKRAEKIS